jgi:HAD superfamily hydrolase (TIGR01509 family)
VLVDSERISARVFAQLLGELGLAFTPTQMFDTFMGNSMQRCLDIVTERLGHAPPEDLLTRYHDIMRVALIDELRPVPGIVALLDRLDAAGVPYAVASNGEHAKMQTTLGVTGLLARFAGRRFSATDVARPKPAPDLFEHAARTLGVVPSRCLVVEDSPLGVRGACAAGMTVIGFSDLMSPQRLHDAGASVVVRELSEVGSVLRLP